MKQLSFSIFLLLLSFVGTTQNNPVKSEIVYLTKIKSVNPITVTSDFHPQLSNLEMPSPGSDKYRLERIKNESKKQFSRAANGEQSWIEMETINPSVEKGIPVINTTIFGTDTFVSHIAGGLPNDNTLAISNDGILLSAFNSKFFAYDTNADTSLFDVMSLHAFSSEFTLNDKFDPKLLYDPIEDRFIMMFLNGRLSTENQIIIAFSSTNNPADEWNLYEVPGNPLNDTTWFDYPAIAITESELFLTGNQLTDNESWQTGFVQSVIWQISKIDGYNGASNVTTKLWSDINDNGHYIRNLNPIQGGSFPTDSNTYFVSNNNFSLQSDTIYLLEITGKLNDLNTELNITLGHTDIPYGAPPNGRQSINDSLATNDARILGGFIENGEIQYVANTVYAKSGFAGVYHGFITNLDETPVFKGTILADDSMDLGYPNIAYSGNHECSQQSVIAVNHTSPERGAGYSAVQYRTDGEYSALITLKDGDGPIDRLTGYERWGDYSGIQRKYNEPGVVWGAGFYARSDNNNYTWISKIKASPQIERLAFNVIDSTSATAYGKSDGGFELQIIGGIEPFSYVWSDSSLTNENNYNNLSAGKFSLTLTDNNNCSFIDTLAVEEPLPAHTVFPNPIIDIANIHFELNTNQLVYVSLFDLKGNLVKQLYADEAKAGQNIFNFSLSPLSIGTYILNVSNEFSTIVEEKIIKF